MAFGFGKKREVLDLTDHYRRQQEKTAEMRAELRSRQSLQKTTSPSSDSSFGGFFGGMSDVGSSQGNEYVTVGGEDSADEKRKKLAKRLSDMTDKIEELSNQIYHLQQRIEVLEKKARVGVFGHE